MSEWVHDEATEGRKQNKLVPVLIEDVSIPMGFRSLQTADLRGWDGKETRPAFEKLVEDVAAQVAAAPTLPKTNEISLAKKIKSQRLREIISPKKTSFFVFFAFFIIILASTGYYVNNNFVSNSEPKQQISLVNVVIYTHRVGFTQKDADELKAKLEKNGIPSKVEEHVNPNAPDCVFIGSLVTAHAARIALTSVPYAIQCIFRTDYPEVSGGDPEGYRIGIGYSSKHNSSIKRPEYKPINISEEHIQYLTEKGLTNQQFQARLREITQARIRE